MYLYETLGNYPCRQDTYHYILATFLCAVHQKSLCPEYETVKPEGLYARFQVLTEV
jgi:hypothetical protein